MSKNAIVTGGTKGLGRALAALLLERGYGVAVVARGREGLDDTRAALGPAGRLVTIQEDVATPDAAARIVGQATAELGPIDLLVNNASILGPTPLRNLLDTSREDFSAVIAANLLGPFELARAVGGAMSVRAAAPS